MFKTKYERFKTDVMLITGYGVPILLYGIYKRVVGVRTWSKIKSNKQFKQQLTWYLVGCKLLNNIIKLNNNKNMQYKTTRRDNSLLEVHNIIPFNMDKWSSYWLMIAITKKVWSVMAVNILTNIPRVCGIRLCWNDKSIINIRYWIISGITTDKVLTFSRFTLAAYVAGFMYRLPVIPLFIKHH